MAEHYIDQAEVWTAPGAFRHVVERSAAGIYLMKRDRFVYVNPRFAEIFGYAPDVIVRELQPLDLVDEEDRPMVAERVRQRLSGEVLADCYTFRGVRRDGRRVVVEVHGSQIELDDERAVLGAVVEVTERARDEQLLRTSEERYRLVLRAASTAVWDCDLASGAVYWNGEYEELLRCNADAVGATIEWWYEQIHPEERERVVGGLTTAIRDGAQRWSAEHRFRRGDGTYATILNRCFVVRNQRGVAERLVGSMLDMTERRRSEDAQRFLARASLVLEQSLDERTVLARLVRIAVPAVADCCLVDLVDADGSVRRVAAAHADRARDALLRRSGCFDEAADPARYPIVRAIRTGEPVLIAPYDPVRRQRIALDQHDAGGDALGVHAFMVLPLLARDGVLGALTLAAAAPERRFDAAALAVAEDLARRLAVSLDKSRLFAETKEALQARDEVLRVVSHDLRNPLNVIQLSAGLLLDSGETLEEEVVDKLQLVRKVALQMNDMIQDLLDAAVMEAGRFEVAATPYPAAQLVDDAGELLTPLAEAQGVELRWSAPRPDVEVSVDANQMLRVFSNLVGNAVKFTPEGGRVSVAVEERADELQFSITDTGPGIPSAEMPNVFEQFWQGRKSDRRGAGLGLVIARGIVEAHGGRIRAASMPGGGATFVFTVPRRHAGRRRG